ncbi:hypothetical protein GOBAR_AA16316 [Gossypium barbadense]|uniref:Uncharacterized protein n=1 Tax=Gossypium barbadense TaxID=3634 RepID=A0A2P5XLZ2_GOSBA|nr:hypothetical protein GOBAR_AA16316 [Gossypium barbadense]
MGNEIKECSETSPEDRIKVDDEHPFSIALKAKSSMVGKECLIFGSIQKKSMKQCFYAGEELGKKEDALLLEKSIPYRRPESEVRSIKNSGKWETEKIQENSEERDSNFSP